MEKVNIYTTLIFESSIDQAKIIKKQLRNDKRIMVEGIYSSFRSIKKSVEIYNPDIIFVDSASLNKRKNSDLFLSLADAHFQETKVIFTYQGNVCESNVFNDYSPDYYLKKPFLHSETIKIIDNIETKKNEDEVIVKNQYSFVDEHGIIYLKFGKGFLLIDPLEVVYIRSAKRGCELTKRNGENQFLKYKISFLENIFKDFNFFRITKSVIINLEYLFMISRKSKRCFLKNCDNEYIFQLTSRNVMAINKLPFIKVG